MQIGEYDSDVGAKEEELAKARQEYEAVIKQLQVGENGGRQPNSRCTDIKSTALRHSQALLSVLPAFWRPLVRFPVALTLTANPTDCASRHTPDPRPPGLHVRVDSHAPGAHGVRGARAEAGTRAVPGGAGDEGLCVREKASPGARRCE